MYGCNWERLTMRLGQYRRALGLLTLLPILLIVICVYLLRDTRYTRIPNEPMVLPLFKGPPHSADCRVRDLLRRMAVFSDATQFQSCQRIVYNRVPKCASRTVLGAFKIISQTNHFNVYNKPKIAGTRNYLSNEDMMRDFVADFREYQDPFLFSQHIHFMDFTEFDEIQPLYINVIRDPIERFTSHFYYNIYGSTSKPQNGTKYANLTLDSCVQERRSPCKYLENVMLPFFCGHSKYCRRPNPGLLQVAKKTVRDNYLVVGVTEDLPAFMEVLETLLPHFFKNISYVFNETGNDMQNWYKTVKKPELSTVTYQRLRKILSREYDFYKFVTQRFYNLLHKVRMYRASRGLHLLLRNQTLA